MADTLAEVSQIIRDVFDDDELSITRSTTAAEVAAWDSLMHVTLVLQVEATFGIKFSSSEIANLKNVGELVDLVDSRRKRH